MEPPPASPPGGKLRAPRRRAMPADWTPAGDVAAAAAAGQVGTPRTARAGRDWQTAMGEMALAAQSFESNTAAVGRVQKLLRYLDLGSHAALVKKMERSGKRVYFTQYQVKHPAEFVQRADIDRATGKHARRAPAGPAPAAPGGGKGGKGGQASRRATLADRVLPKDARALLRRRSITVLLAVGENARKQAAAAAAAPDAGGGGGGVDPPREEGERMELWRAYTSYCLFKDPHSGAFMSCTAFIKFARDCDLTSEFTFADLDVLFSSVAAKKALGWGTGAKVTFQGFVTLLRQLHGIVAADAPAATPPFEDYLRRQILDSLRAAAFAAGGVKDEHEDHLTLSDLWQAVAKQEHILYVVFCHYRNLQTRGRGGPPPTPDLPFEAFEKFALNFGLFPQLLSRAVFYLAVGESLRRRKARTAAAQGPAAAPAALAVNFSQFLEVLCRCALKAAALRGGGGGEDADAGGGAGWEAPTRTSFTPLKPKDPRFQETRDVWIPRMFPTQKLSLSAPHPTPLNVPPAQRVRRPSWATVRVRPATVYDAGAEAGAKGGPGGWYRPVSAPVHLKRREYVRPQSAPGFAGFRAAPGEVTAAGLSKVAWRPHARVGGGGAGGGRPSAGVAGRRLVLMGDSTLVGGGGG